ncbi:TonB-dependent receptor domain-containing protein [Brevundimonas sp. NPDC092305]|uniref:TonB-dependent receptor domain-containing protein n=1 Tax=Brevundimonas sp. NPDC092305 TaxID=3363957 RepID=UPI003803F6F7
MNRLNLLSCSALVACVAAISPSACAQEARAFNIPAGPLGDALNAYATQSDQQILFSSSLVEGLRTQGLRGRYAPADALNRLLAGTGLSGRETRPGVIVLRRAEAAEAPVAANLDDVIVTGTLLRSSGDLASPVIVLDRDALDRRGLGTVAEILVDIPQNYAGSATSVVQATSSDNGGSNQVFSTGVNLRGLGPASTLTLINGRRLAGTGSRAEFADISALPSAAVERVDVLLDGASALYGADAIAGVVNVIMRKRVDGAESRVRVAAARGGGESVIASHLMGQDWETGSAYISYEYEHTNGLSSLDRDYTRDGDLRPFGGSDRRAFNSFPGNIVSFNAATGSYTSLFAIRPDASGSARTAADFAPGAANLQTLSQGVGLVPDLERHSAYARFSQSVGDRLDLTGDVRWSRRVNENLQTPISGVFTVSRANPFFVSPTGAASHTIGYSFAGDLGLPRQHTRAESVAVTFGGVYRFMDAWSLDAYVTGAEERSSPGSTNRVNTRFLAEALGNIPDDPATPYRAAVDGYFNMFGDGTVNGRAVLDFISQGMSRSYSRSRATSANVLAQGPVLSLPGGEVMIAVGAQSRDEFYETRNVALTSTVAPQYSSTPRRGRSISAVFAEARVPLVGPDNAVPGVRSLDLSVAGRYEEYSDFGSTTNPKVGLVWSPIEGLGVRASWGTSFRAGALAQLADAQSASPLFLSRADGSRPLTLSLGGGNPDLEPETSETLTLGIDYRPSGGASVSFNAFDTRFTDRIARPVSENINGALTDPALANFVTFINPAANPADLALIQSYSGFLGFSTLYPLTTYAAIIDSRWVNTGAVRVKGIDLSGRVPLSFAGGRLTLDGSASYLLDYDTQSTPTAPVRSVVGLIGFPSRLRARAGAVWARGDFDVGAHWTHVHAYEDRLGAAIDASNLVDARINWSPTLHGRGGMRLTLAVENLFDEDPPFYNGPLGFGFDGGQASPMGRTVSFQISKRW